MSARTFWDGPRPSVFQCSECSTTVQDPDDVAFDATCKKCQADLHCCRNCTFFDSAAENECRKEIDVRVPKKRANNECALFEAVKIVNLHGGGEARSTQDAKADFDALFKI